MFIVGLTYLVDLDVVDEHLEEHKKYLEEYKNKGIFLASGRKEPRTGGIIFAQVESKESLLSILKEDSFYRSKIAKYSIIEFEPTMLADGINLCNE